jgi:hypothetical protein
MVSNLALFCLATFQKIGQFFPTHLVTLMVTNRSEKHGALTVIKNPNLSHLIVLFSILS